MPTFPLTFPNVGITESSFKLNRTVAESRSPFTAERQVYRFPGEWWEGTITLPPMKRAQAAEVQAFLAQLSGMWGTFLFGDPDAKATGLLGTGGTILVNGAGQTGNTLQVDGMTAGAANVLKRGDYFQLGSGATSRLYMVTENLNANGAGASTLEFEPRLRSSPADNAALVLTNPRTVMQLTDNSAEWGGNNASVYNITLAFREVL